VRVSKDLAAMCHRVVCGKVAFIIAGGAGILERVVPAHGVADSIGRPSDLHFAHAESEGVCCQRRSNLNGPLAVLHVLRLEVHHTARCGEAELGAIRGNVPPLRVHDGVAG
jgi:hypothetical protein